MNQKTNSLADFAQARDGDEQAMNRLLETWRHRLRVAARNQLRQVRSRVDTSDAVQDGLIQAWQSIPTFHSQSEGQFRSWIRKIAKGRLANTRRFHNAERRSVRTDIGPKFLPTCVSREQQATDDDSTISNLRLAIQKLEPKLQLIVQRRYFDNLTFREIAEEVGCSAGGARTMCERAVQQLRRTLKNPHSESSHSDPR